MAALYAKGIFTTIEINNSQPFLWEKHWRRIQHDAAAVSIDLAEYSEEDARKALAEIVKVNSVVNGRARLTFFDGSAAGIWDGAARRKTHLLVITAKLRQISEWFRLTISPYDVNSKSPLAGIKSCNYVERIMALDQAKTRGYDEAIQLNERGLITSATMANVFWLRDNALFTPTLKTGCLPGTTRGFILENLDCREVEVPIDELNLADAIFLTSAGLGVVQVAEFESRRFDKIDHPILSLLPKNN